MSSTLTQPTSAQRMRTVIRGAVQGVGFRPFVFRLATEMGLKGWVNNTSQGVFIEAEGDTADLRNFLLRLDSEKPEHSSIHSLESSFLDPVPYESFEIRHSEGTGEKNVFVMPDIATCKDCLEEVFDPTDRRYRYPFANCTHCGPRYSIIEGLPYDRPNTSMKVFEMCQHCRAEYENPADRRFHAQPIACPTCGPHLELWDVKGKKLAREHDALLQAAVLLRQGSIVAVKGLGGFHLVADARRDDYVRRLRRRKHREEKPLAIMFPGLSSVEAECEIAGLERRMLLSPEAPIVLLSRKVGETCICPSVAPGNPSLGAMLPYTPLHHLLLDEAGFPVVATSGNLTDEPICIDEQEALERLRGIADCFLVHNRPVVRHVDDSVVRLMAGREMVLRRARGFAPLPVPLKSGIEPVLAVGAHLKNTVAVGGGESVFVSQHIGDLDTAQSLDAFHRTIESLSGLYDHKPAKVACDLHPDYVSTQFAREQQLPVTPVQHHFAHVLSCMAENELDPPVLGVSWDGTGYGLDGTVWGGEFLLATGRGEFERFAALRPFRLPGGEHAIREPRRSALGLLFELGESVSGPMAMARDRFEPGQASVLCQMLKSGLNAPLTSSMGRLYDAIASLLGIRQQHQFEGQAAMELEFLAHQAETEESYPFEVVKNPNYDPGQEPGKTPRWLIDWAPLVLLLVREIANAESTSLCAAKFHNSLVEFILSIAQIAGERRVALTGGCFQNRYLTERAVTRLEHSGFRPYWHQRIPPNDGGIALGQSWAANE